MITFNKNMNFFLIKFANFLKITNCWKYLIAYFWKEHSLAKIFIYVNHIESKDCIGYVICKTCKQALKHNKSTSGTTHLNDHLKRCKYNAKISPKVTAYFSKSGMSLSKVIKNTVLNSSVNL